MDDDRPAADPTTGAAPPSSMAGRDFRLYFGGQLVSNVGNAITDFALPLLVYQVTGSELALGLAFAIRMVPYLLFGLPIGAWVDRLDRKRLMVASDVLNGALLLPIPILALTGTLPIELVFVFLFLSSTLNIVYDTGQFAAITSLVRQDELIRANGRVRSSYQAASVIGAPIVGGLVWLGIRLEAVLLIDAVTFLVSATALSLTRTSFNAPEGDEPTPVGSILSDIRAGLAFVIGHPLMRATLTMAAIINLTTTVVPAQLIAFGTDSLGATDTQLSFLTMAGAVGAIGLALSAGWLRERLSFTAVTFPAVVLAGLLVVALSFTGSVWVALPLWGLAFGMTILFNITLGSLWQMVTPPQMMGRVVATAQVLSWSLIPIGALGGSQIAEATGRLDTVFLLSGLSMVVIAVAFFGLTALRDPVRYAPEAAAMRTLPPPGPDGSPAD